MASRADKRKLVGELITAFREAGNQDASFEALAADSLGISAADLRCLNAIENAGGLTPGELARAVGVTSGAVTGVVDRLERAGYARREPDPADRRRLRIEVTPQFRKRAEDIWGPLAADWMKELTTRFTAAELGSALELLQLTTEINRRHRPRLEGEPS